MFKELKLIKLLVFGGLLFAIILKMDLPDLLLKELFTDKPSYYPGEVVKVYTSTDFFISYSDNMEITDCAGKVVDTFKAQIKNQLSTSKNVLSEGLNFKTFVEYKIPDKLKSGIYLINNKFPLIIKSKEKYTITVVYPFINNVFYQSVEDKTVFSENNKYASLLRTTPFDKYSEGLKSLFVGLENSSSVNYISDIDLEKISNFESSKLLIIYGKSTCWTPKMRSSVDDYIKNGGNILLMTTYACNNICWYNPYLKNITMYDSVSTKMCSWPNYDSLNYKNILGVSYLNGGYSTAIHYKIANSTHPILAKISGNEIKFNADLYSSPPIIWYDDLPRIDLTSLGFYKGDLIAYNTASYRKEDKGIKGIFVLQPDSTSGKIVSLGSEDWCIKENFEGKIELQLITQNAIDYLLKPVVHL